MTERPSFLDRRALPSHLLLSPQVLDLNISDKALRIYLVLIRFSRRDAHAVVTMAELGLICWPDVASETAYRKASDAIRELEQADLLEVASRYGENGARLPNAYVLKGE